MLPSERDRLVPQLRARTARGRPRVGSGADQGVARPGPAARCASSSAAECRAGPGSPGPPRSRRRSSTAGGASRSASRCGCRRWLSSRTRMPRPARPPTAAGTRMPIRPHQRGSGTGRPGRSPATSITAGASPESDCAVTCGWPRLVIQGEARGASWFIHHTVPGEVVHLRKPVVEQEDQVDGQGDRERHAGPRPVLGRRPPAPSPSWSAGRARAAGPPGWRSRSGSRSVPRSAAGPPRRTRPVRTGSSRRRASRSDSWPTQTPASRSSGTESALVDVDLQQCVVVVPVTDDQPPRPAVHLAEPGADDLVVACCATARSAATCRSA